MIRSVLLCSSFHKRSAISCCHYHSIQGFSCLLTTPFKTQTQRPNNFVIHNSTFLTHKLVRYNSSHTSSKCPFTVLGVSKTAMYGDVKQAFIKLALQHHPDTAGPSLSSSASKSKSKKSTTEIFFRIRHAFESIRADDQGNAILVEEEMMGVHEEENYGSGGQHRWTDEEMTAWFHQETGRKLSFYMDDFTRQEVIQVSKTMSRGGLDRGGMWEMAASLEREEQFRKENNKGRRPPKVPLQVTEGDSTKRRRARRRTRGR